MKLKLLLFFCWLSLSIYGQQNNIKLNFPFTLPFTNVIDFQMNAEHVVYLADHEKYTKIELYSVPINGGTVIKLNPPLDDSGQILNFKIVGNQVYYTTRLDLIKNTTDLFVVPITGGVSTQVNPLLAIFGRIDQFEIIDNQVVYMADKAISGKVELFQMDLSNGTVTKLSHILKSREKVVDFIVEDNWVAYRTEDRTGLTLYELYGVPIGGGVVNKLNSPLVTFGDVHPDYQISNGFVIYLADQDINVTDELYSVPVDGGVVTKLNPPFPIGKDVFSFQAKNNNVIYVADQDIDGVKELYQVPITGGQSKKLNPDLILGMGVDDDFQIINDTIFYRAIQETNFYSNKIYKVALDGGKVDLLSPPLPIFGRVYNFKVFDNSIVYTANQDDVNAVEIYSMPRSGGQSVVLNQPLFAGNRFLEFYDKVGDKVVYMAFQETDRRELFSVDCPLFRPIISPIPTLGEWGLLIYGLVILNLSLFLLKFLKTDTIE